MPSKFYRTKGTDSKLLWPILAFALGGFSRFAFWRRGPDWHLKRRRHYRAPEHPLDKVVPVWHAPPAE